VFMSQDVVEALWKKYPSEGAATTPISTGFDWAAASTQTTKCDQKKYQSAVGSLLYLARMTRPDILYATALWGRYASKQSNHSALERSCENSRLFIPHQKGWDSNYEAKKH
jgi:hypothetical protein